MPNAQEEWISSTEAARILSENSGHPILPQYVQILKSQGKVQTKMFNGKARMYLRSDIEGCRVKQYQPRKHAAVSPADTHQV